jgi:hypothetical protein
MVAGFRMRMREGKKEVGRIQEPGFREGKRTIQAGRIAVRG